MVDGDFSEADVVELLYNWMFYGIVENFVCRMWESWSLLFHVLWTEFHSEIYGYTQFYDVVFVD